MQYTGCSLKHTQNMKVVRDNNLSPIAEFQMYDSFARPLALTSLNLIIQVFSDVDW